MSSSSVLSLLSRDERHIFGINLTHPTVSLYFMLDTDGRSTVGEWWPSYRPGPDRPMRMEPLHVRDPFGDCTPPRKVFTLVAKNGEDVQLLHNGEPHPWFDVAHVIVNDYRAAQWPERLAYLVEHLPTVSQLTVAVTEAFDAHVRQLYRDRRLDLLTPGAAHAKAVCSKQCITRRCNSVPTPEHFLFSCDVTCDTPLALIAFRVLSSAAAPIVRRIALQHIRAFTNQLVVDAATITNGLPHHH